MAQHTKAVDWVPGADEEAVMEREVGDDLSIANGREGPMVVTMVSRPLEDPRWSDGNPPGSRVSEYTDPGVRMAVIDKPPLHPMNPEWE